MRSERGKVLKQAEVFAPLLSNPDLSETEIDAAIEELRSLRMKIHAIDYGSAPGFRKPEPAFNEEQRQSKSAKP
jgi:hypothetical protein